MERRSSSVQVQAAGMGRGVARDVAAPDARPPAGVAARLPGAVRAALLALGIAAVAPGVPAQSQLPRAEPVLPSPDPVQSGAVQAGAPPAGAARSGTITGGNPPPPFGGLAGQPAVSPPLPVVAGVVPWDLLGQVKTVRVKDRFVPEFSPSVAKLNRQDVKIVGFMMPLEAGEKQRHFLLTVTSQTCAFCIPAGPEGIVEVRTRSPVAMTFEPLVIAGRLEVLRDDPLGVYYRISNGTSVPLR
jgi:hypothetical protein